MLLMTAITGVIYPLTVTGIAQLAFPEQANGSLVRDSAGKVLGSALIAQDFTGDGGKRPRRRPRVEPAVASEILRNQRRPQYLAGTVTHQAAIGLFRERQLGNAGHGQRVDHAGNGGHQQQQAQGRG